MTPSLTFLKSLAVVSQDYRQPLQAGGQGSVWVLLLELLTAELVLVRLLQERVYC